jgi:hypothetical protein
MGKWKSGATLCNLLFDGGVGVADGGVGNSGGWVVMSLFYWDWLLMAFIQPRSRE